MQTSFTKPTITDQLFGWWYAIATPSVDADAPLREREFVRRAKFTSIVLLIEIVLSVVDLVLSPQLGPTLYVPVLVTILSMLIGVLLNRAGKTRAASILVLVVIEIGMCTFLINTNFVPGGMHSLNATSFIILIQPNIIAASMFSTAVALPVGLFNSLYTFVLLLYVPKSQEMLAQLAPGPMNLYYPTISTQIVVMLVGIFWASSTFQEMNRADRAEEVNRLIQELAAQQKQALQEKEKLEESIQQIVKIHMQVANGDLSARVPLDKGNALWLIAGSLNNLLARLQRWRQDAQRQQQTEQAIQQLFHNIQRAKQQGSPLSMEKTGTSLDAVIAELTGVTVS
jgi:hypothetical protein